MQEKQSSCQPARVSPGSTVQAEGGSCLGKIWGSEAVSSFGPATRLIYQRQTNKKNPKQLRICSVASLIGGGSG